MQLVNKVEGLEEFEENPLFRQFLAEDVDVRAVTSSAVQSAAVAEQLAQLGAGILLLDKALRHQVSNHYEDLLSQATEIETLEEVLLGVGERMNILLTSAQRLRSRVGEPYQQILEFTRKLQRLHSVCDLLRKVTGVVRNTRRLRATLPKDHSKALVCLNEIENTLGETDLTGLTVIDEEIAFIEHARDILKK